MQEKHSPLVSVCTCAYNMADKIHRVFDSMKAMDYPNLEHIIVDDGSSDHLEELVEKYKSEVSFPVKYVYKENGGKHTALNRAWDMAEGEFVLTCDADDALFPHCVRFLVDTYYEIPEDKREEYWCVQGRCVTQNGEFVGDRYPEDINDHPWREAGKIASTCKGEKFGLKKKAVLDAYRFPEVVGVTYVPEGIIWRQLNKRYGTYYTNETVRTYYVNEGGNLTAAPRSRRQLAAKAFLLKYKLMNKAEYGSVGRNLILYSLLYCLSWDKYRKNNPYFEGLSSFKLALALLYPFASMAALGIRLIKKIK